MSLSLVVTISEAASRNYCINIIKAQVLQMVLFQPSSYRRPPKFANNMPMCCRPDQAMLSRQKVALITHQNRATGIQLISQDARQLCKVAWTMYHHYNSGTTV